MPPLALVGIGIAAIGLFAFLVTRGSTSDGKLAYGDVTVAGSSLPRHGEGTDAAVGVDAPKLSGEDFDGVPIEIASKGRPMAIVFLAHWCPHCQTEVSDLVPWFKENGMPEGIDFYSVATLTDASRPNYPPANWLDDAGWELPVLVDDRDDTAANAYGLTGTPLWVFVDSQGKVAARLSGEIGGDGLKQILDTLK